MKHFGDPHQPDLSLTYFRLYENYGKIHTEKISSKNKTSFFGYSGKKYSLIENNTIVAYGVLDKIEKRNLIRAGRWLRPDIHAIRDAVYIPEQNTYFFTDNFFLYRKTIDQKKPKFTT